VALLPGHCPCGFCGSVSIQKYAPKTYNVLFIKSRNALTIIIAYLATNIISQKRSTRKIWVVGYNNILKYNITIALHIRT